jgi:hypothetical protein
MITKDFMLTVAKKFFNEVFPRFTSQIPRVKNPRKNVCKLFDRVFKRLDKSFAYQYEDNYTDRNFPKFVENFQHLLMYIAENDGHYRAWLAQAVVVLCEEYVKEWNEFNPIAYYNAERKKLVLNVPLKSAEAKTFLFYDYLTQHHMNFAPNKNLFERKYD